MTQERFICILPSYGSNMDQWRIEGLEGNIVYDAEGPFESKEDAVNAIADYAESLEWKPENYTVTIDE